MDLRQQPVVGGIAVQRWSDERLADEQRAIAAERRRLDARAAVVAAEIARRARDERAGVDQVQRLTGATRAESQALVDAGRLVDPARPGWLSPVGDAVASGALGVAAAGAISRGLGDAGITADPAALESAAARLVDDASWVPVERLAARARTERDLLDARGIAERETTRRERRFLTLVPLADGMTRIAGLLDTESAARVRSAFDQVTAPRRSTPRFVDESERERADGIADDPRTTPQLLHDAFVEMVERAVAADDGTIFGARQPGVRVHVALRDLQSTNPSTGSAQIEGSADAVSVDTAQRIACVAGVVPIVFDTDGAPLDVGRTQRLHTTKQRIAIAARDGGCRWPGCDRPPSRTEVHHPVPWSAGGDTSVDNGISLCAHHHLRVHNEGWRVRRRQGDFWLTPPPDRGGDELAMPSSNRIVV